MECFLNVRTSEANPCTFACICHEQSASVKHHDSNPQFITTTTLQHTALTTKKKSSSNL